LLKLGFFNLPCSPDLLDVMKVLDTVTEANAILIIATDPSGVYQD